MYNLNLFAFIIHLWCTSFGMDFPSVFDFVYTLLIISFVEI